MSDEKTVSILGRGPSWVQCPFEGDIWATSSVLLVPGMEDKHYDLLFAFDNPDAWVCPPNKDNKLKNEILPLAKEKGIPVMSTFPYADERYPLLDIFNEFGVTYMKNTISYMLSLAIFRGYKNIYLYGVDQDEELDIYQLPYSRGKSYVTFWLGIAHGRGINYGVANKDFPYRMEPGMRRVLDKIYEKPKTREQYYELLCKK